MQTKPDKGFFQADFIAVDLETANQSNSSICQIGLAAFKGEKLIAEHVELINPESSFSSFNIKIHGIQQHEVQEARLFPEVYKSHILPLKDKLFISHSSFDSTAIKKACEKYGLALSDFFFADSIKVAKDAWPRSEINSYALANLARFLNIQFQHHDALEDARCAGYVVLAALKKSGLALENYHPAEAKLYPNYSLFHLICDAKENYVLYSAIQKAKKDYTRLLEEQKTFIRVINRTVKLNKQIDVPKNELAEAILGAKAILATIEKLKQDELKKLVPGEKVRLGHLLYTWLRREHFLLARLHS